MPRAFKNPELRSRRLSEKLKGKKAWNKDIIKRTRNCIVCNELFTKGYNTSMNEWNRSRKSCSKQCADIYKKGQKLKENNPRWKGGRESYLKREVRIRDDYTCQICGFREPEIMEIDHVLPKATNPHLTYNMDNLITLCPNCHRRKTIREFKGGLTKINRANLSA